MHCTWIHGGFTKEIKLWSLKVFAQFPMELFHFPLVNCSHSCINLLPGRVFRTIGWKVQYVQKWNSYWLQNHTPKVFLVNLFFGNFKTSKSFWYGIYLDYFVNGLLDFSVCQCWYWMSDNWGKPIGCFLVRVSLDIYFFWKRSFSWASKSYMTDRTFCGWVGFLVCFLWVIIVWEGWYVRQGEL